MSETAAKPGCRRLLIAGGLAALAPKCFGCVAGYFALVTGLAATAPELCGVVANDAASPPWWASALAGGVSGGGFWLVAQIRARARAAAVTSAPRSSVR